LPSAAVLKKFATMRTLFSGGGSELKIREQAHPCFGSR